MSGNEERSAELSTPQLVKRLAALLAISGAVGILGKAGGLEFHQQVASSVFLAIILGTLFFWNFRLAIAFLGLSVLIFTKSLNIPHFVESAALPVILFLVGMMIVVGALRDLGFFTWVVQMIVSMPKMTGRKFIITLAMASALLACAVDEVTSIIFITTLVFQVCNRLKLNPTPYVIICVLCTNVGSAGTMLGNPVGIYIGTQAGLTFHDFIVWAFPIMLVALAVTGALTLLWFRKELRLFDERLKERMERQLSLVPQVSVPYKRGLALLIVTVLFIASHHYLEDLLDLDKNSILLVAPLVCSGIVMIARRKRARHYVEREVDWWTLLFFMLLFAIAGTLEYTEVNHAARRPFQAKSWNKHGRPRADDHRRHRRRLRVRGQRHFRRRLLPRHPRTRRLRPRNAPLVGAALRGVHRRQYHHDRQHGQHRRPGHAREAVSLANPLLGVAQSRPAFSGCSLLRGLDSARASQSIHAVRQNRPAPRRSTSAYAGPFHAFRRRAQRATLVDMEEHASQLVCPYANRPRGDLAMAVQCLLVAVLATVTAPSALPCTDDNVRGAAFNVPRDVHRLCLFARENDALAREHFARLARWLDTEGKDLNVQLEWVLADAPNTNWADYGLPSAPPTIPVTALIGCDTASGRAFIIDHWDPAPTDAELSVLTHSPAREAIHRGVLDRWAVLLHVPSAQDNARPREGPRPGRREVEQRVSPGRLYCADRPR